MKVKIPGAAGDGEAPLPAAAAVDQQAAAGEANLGGEKCKRGRGGNQGAKNVSLFVYFISKVATKEARMKEDRQQEDMRLVTQLDQKVSDQQVRKALIYYPPNCL